MLAKQAQQNRMNALNSMASTASQIEAQDYSRQANTATAQDAIQKFNAQVRNTAGQYNNQTQQQLANQKASTANQQEIYNKGLQQQDYNNRLNRANASIGMATQTANNQAQGALTVGQGAANMWSGIGNAVGGLAGTFAQQSTGSPSVPKPGDPNFTGPVKP